jgi:hypothetical protein
MGKRTDGFLKRAGGVGLVRVATGEFSGRRICDCFVAHDYGDPLVDKANAEHIVECWNAFEGHEGVITHGMVRDLVHNENVLVRAVMDACDALDNSGGHTICNIVSAKLVKALEKVQRETGGAEVEDGN